MPIINIPKPTILFKINVKKEGINQADVAVSAWNRNKEGYIEIGKTTTDGNALLNINNICDDYNNNDEILFYASKDEYEGFGIITLDISQQIQNCNIILYPKKRSLFGIN